MDHLRRLVHFRKASEEARKGVAWRFKAEVQVALELLVRAPDVAATDA